MAITNCTKNKLTSNYYVVCDDSFMSGWGKAEGLTNRLIFLCDTRKQAEIVANNANNRSDMSNVSIRSTKPSELKLKQGKDYAYQGMYIQVKTIEDYPSWYVENYFAKT